MWTDPGVAKQASRLAECCRVVGFQQMGLGLSDAVDRVPTLEEQASDIEAVMDAEGVSSAVLVGAGVTPMPIVLFASRAPQRVEALVLIDPYAQGPRNDTYERIAGMTAEEAESFAALLEKGLAQWGEGRMLDWWDPVIAPHNRARMAVLERAEATPAVAAAVCEAALTSDVRDVLPQVRAPTRVLRRPTNPLVPERASRLVAELIPNATFHVLPASEPYMSYGESLGPGFDQLIEVVAGRPPSTAHDRQLASILFTDVVSSTELVSAHGDARWRNLLERHEEAIRRRVEAESGRLVKLMGDGSMGVFSGPAAAIRAAQLIRDDARMDDLSVRAGIHTGECERMAGGDLSGLAVHIAARVGAAAGPGEVWVSRTVRDLIGGSGLQLKSMGIHQLKGVAEEWELFSVVGQDETAAAIAEEPSAMRAGDRLILATARRAPRLLRGLNRIETSRRRRASANR
jgi:class 3 adenylate cyclase/pimeloyl-ACP methyl ester carboxylesterase